MKPLQQRHRGALGLMTALCLALVACGGGSGSEAETARCSIAKSELGPFSPETTLGQSMNEDEARARMAQDDIVGWLAVNADGPWDQSWTLATATLGQSIHGDLTWLDVNGTINNLYERGDQFEFADLRVSRSFQGKIEHTDESFYLPLQDVGVAVDFDAACAVTALEFGDANNDQLLDVFDATSSAG
jgi:hypothetical protein